jgi:hypothetical protein
MSGCIATSATSCNAEPPPLNLHIVAQDNLRKASSSIQINDPAVPEFTSHRPHQPHRKTQPLNHHHDITTHSQHLIILVLPHNLLLLRNRLQRLILVLRFLLANNSNEGFVVAILLRFVLVLRPRRHVLEEFFGQVVADAAAGFTLVVAGFVDAAMLVVTRVGDFFVGEDAGGEEEGEGEELHGWWVFGGFGIGLKGGGCGIDERVDC